MNFAEPFIRRPVATTLLVLTILIFGIMGYRLLPVSDLPTVDFPTIQVNANLPGASPETMAVVGRDAARETVLDDRRRRRRSARATARAARTSRCSSISSRDIDAAAQDVQSMIARAQRQLPPGMPSPPSFQKVQPGRSPVLFLTLSSPTLPLSQVDRYAETVLAQRLSMVSGVAQVNVFGAQKFAVRVDVDPHAARGAADRHRPGRAGGRSGRTSTGRPARSTGPTATSSSRPSGQLMNADGYRPIVVAYRNGSPVRLDEVAQRLRRRRERRATPSWYNGTPHDLPRDPAPAGHQHRRGRGPRSRRCCRSCRRSCRRRSSSRIRSDRSVSIRESVARREVHAAADGRASSSSSSSCSCATSRRRSSPASRCRSRSSARSR